MLSAFMAVVLLAAVAAVFFGIKGGGPRPADATVEPAPINTPKPKPVDPVTATPTPTPAAERADVMEIEQALLDGQDIADVLNLWMWKFKFHMPQERYTCSVWMERWTRDAAQPEVRTLFQQAMPMDGGELVIKLPTASHPQQLVRLGSAKRSANNAPPLEIGEPMGLEMLEKREEFKAGQDIYLITITQNTGVIKSGAPRFGRKGVQAGNDVTIYVKARFTTTPPGPLTMEWGQSIEF